REAAPPSTGSATSACEHRSDRLPRSEHANPWTRPRMRFRRPGASYLHRGALRARAPEHLAVDGQAALWRAARPTLDPRAEAESCGPRPLRWPRSAAGTSPNHGSDDAEPGAPWPASQTVRRRWGSSDAR